MRLGVESFVRLLENSLPRQLDLQFGVDNRPGASTTPMESHDERLAAFRLFECLHVHTAVIFRSTFFRCPYQRGSPRVYTLSNAVAHSITILITGTCEEIMSQSSSPS